MADDWCRRPRRGSPPTRARVDAGLAREGLALFCELSRTGPSEVLLFTDLHAGNVRASERRLWLLIDPKPYVGDPHYDVLQHLLNCNGSLQVRPDRAVDRGRRPRRPGRDTGPAAAVRPLRAREPGRGSAVASARRRAAPAGRSVAIAEAHLWRHRRGWEGELTPGPRRSGLAERPAVEAAIEPPTLSVTAATQATIATMPRTSASRGWGEELSVQYQTIRKCGWSMRRTELPVK